jgi:branched-chain amino acid transport system substrate-binding protein
MKKTSIVIGVIIVILIIIGLTSGSKKGSVSTNGTIKVGVILPLTGPAAAMGETSKKSVELALANLSESERKNIEIVYGDDQLDTKQTVAIAQKLIDVDKVNAIVAWSSPTAVAASYIAEKNSIPMIGLGNSPEINTNKKWAVRYMLGPNAQANAIKTMLLDGKYKKVALMWNQSDGPKSVHDELVKILPAGGFTVVADESVTKAENDFKTSITKIRASKPDVVVVYISPQVGVFGKQAKDLGLNVPLVSGPTFEIVEQVRAAQGGLDNQLYVGADNVAFMDNFFAKYNTYPTIAGDYLYDAITQLAKDAGKNNTEIVDSLKKDFTGVAGMYKYNGDGSFDLAQVVKRWDGEKYVVVK